MNKIWQVFILIAIAVLAWFLLKSNKVEDEMMGEESSVIQEENITTDSSADSVMTSIYADADVDASSANAESEEGAYVEGQVDAFTNIKDTQYENNI